MPFFKLALERLSMEWKALPPTQTGIKSRQGFVQHVPIQAVATQLDWDNCSGLAMEQTGKPSQRDRYLSTIG